MFFINAISLTAALALAPVSFGAPTNSTPATSPNDHIYQNLAAAGKLNWKPSNGGHLVSIAKEDWDAADKQGSSTKRSPNPQFDQQGGDIGGLAVDLVCYGRGAVMQDTEIAAFTIKACDALVGATVPAPVLQVLQVWQSADFPDVNGNNGYLRFSFELLNAITTIPDVTICQAAMAEFQNFCQDGNGNSQGGEATIGGGSYKFDVDPTDDGDNY